MKLVHKFSDSRVRELLHVERPESPDVVLRTRTELGPAMHDHIGKTWRVCDYDTAVVHRLMRHVAAEVDQILEDCWRTRGEGSGDGYKWGDLSPRSRQRLDVLVGFLKSMVARLEEERGAGALNHDQMVERYHCYGEQSGEEMEMEEKMAAAAGLEEW